MAETRERMSGTVAAIESRVSGATDAAKKKLDAARLVREHPWPALAAALFAGVTLSATRADEEVAESAEVGDGVVDRAKAVAARAVRTQADRVEGELRRASEEIGAPPNDQRA